MHLPPTTPVSAVRPGTDAPQMVSQIKKPVLRVIIRRVPDRLAVLNVDKVKYEDTMDESFRDYSWNQDFEDDFDFPQKVILKMLN